MVFTVIMCPSSNGIWKILLFPWKNTNTLTPFPKCEHLKKETPTQLSNPKQTELKKNYECFVVDLSQLIAGKVLTLLTSHRQVVTWTKGERKAVWKNWRSGDFPSEMIKMNHLLHHHDSKFWAFQKWKWTWWWTDPFVHEVYNWFHFGIRHLLPSPPTK